MFNNETQSLKLIDFDKAQPLSEDGLSKKTWGTEYYISPELANYAGKFSLEKNDVWQIGVVWYCLVFSSFPFASRRDIVWKNIEDKIMNAAENIGSNSDVQLMMSMLSKDPSNRPALEVIVIALD